MRQNHFGGIVEYATAVLLVLQILLARAWLLKRRTIWPRAAWLTAVATLAVLWTIAGIAVTLTWSGAIYSMKSVPVTLRTGVVATGYFWILLSSVGMAVGLVVNWVGKRLPGNHSPGRRNWLRAAWVAGVAVPSAAVAFGALVERNQYGVDELDFPIPDLHPDLEGLRIVQVSDLHVSPFLSPREAGRVIDMANELRADLALFTGDLISEPGDPLDDAIRELIRLRGTLGVLGCMGNHEAYVGCRNYLERRARPAVNFLRDRNTQITRGGGTLNIVGVDYQRNADRANYLSGAERLMVPGATNLLLSHNPDVFPAAVRRGFQAVLSGHTHGGQINVEILHQNVNPARFRTPYTSGLYRHEGPGETPASCYVTNGIGTIGMPIRLGAPPQIALLRLRRA